MNGKHIAIVGAGLGGLVLARILQLHSIPCAVYELDVASDVRKQGGSLDMHEDSGQFALRTAGLYQQFCLLTQPQGEAIRVLDKHGTVLINRAPEAGGSSRPEINRTDLRNLLISSLSPGTVVWDRKLTAIRVVGEGRHELSFATGSRTLADLVVGADGTWSKVRTLLSAARPEYCGITYLDLHLSDADKRHPTLAALVGSGMFFALSDNKGIIGHGGTNIHLGCSLRVSEGWAVDSGVDWSDSSMVRELLLKEFADWSVELRALIRHCEYQATPRLIYALPIGHAWAHSRGVTLLGDAAHVMSPYAGEGANLAMRDATDLALGLAEHGDDIETALKRYEATMFLRSKVSAKKSAQGLDMCFAADAPINLVHFFRSMGEPVEN